MDIMAFTEEDRIEALKTSGTGMWRLESGENMSPRFYGDEYMNMLIGVADDVSPEERFNIFMSRINPEDMNKFMEYYNELKAKMQAEIVYRYDHPDMGTIYVRCGGGRASQKDGITCYRGFHQNVTNTIRIEQETSKRLTKQAELYRTVAFKLMENYSDASARINLTTGEFEWLSFDKDEVTLYPSYEEIFKNVASNIPEEYREEFLNNASLNNISEQIKAKGTYSFSTFVHREEDGELRRVTYWYSSFDEERNLVLSVYKDTTEDYILEKQLADALIMAQQANKAKTIFLSNMSHDIRTPMNAIIGFTDLAEKHMEDKDKCIDYLDKIKTSSEHLLALINDVLEMSRIESGRMVLHEETCSLTSCMEGLEVILKADAEKKGLRLNVDCSKIKNSIVVCDKLRLDQVLMNCASNAIKFTPNGGRIDIIASQSSDRFVEEGYGEYQFVVEDSGIGMSDEFLAHIFEPFSREESQVHQIQGTGLGMSICKNIVDMMDGKIDVSSKVGEGTRFTITLRLKIADDGICDDDTNDGDALFTLEGKKVLLAEDNLLNQEIAVEILEEAGAVVEVADNGAEAVEKVKASTPNYYDLILMDVQMPVMGGYEATETIRALDREDSESLKIIAMTANAFEEDKRLALEKGMNGHLSKPIDIKVMETTISQIISN